MRYSSPQTGRRIETAAGGLGPSRFLSPGHPAQRQRDAREMAGAGQREAGRRRCQQIHGACPRRGNVANRPQATLLCGTVHATKHAAPLKWTGPDCNPPSHRPTPSSHGYCCAAIVRALTVARPAEAGLQVSRSDCFTVGRS